MVKVVVVTGSVCSGKTTVAKVLAERLGFEYVDVNEVIDKNPDVVSGYDEGLKTKIVDSDKLVEVLKRIIRDSENDLVIDSHLGHYLPKDYVDVCVVVKCSDLDVLRKRLEARGYGMKKIRENLDAEILDVCLIDALEAGHSVLSVDSSGGVDYDDLVMRVREVL